MHLHLIALLLTLALALPPDLALGDEVRIITGNGGKQPAAAAAGQKRPEAANNGRQQETKQPEELSKKEEIVRQFFEYEGISPDLGGSTLDLYEQDVVDKMAELLEKKKDFMIVFSLNSKINSMLFEMVNRRVTDAERPLRLLDEVLLQTIDLMVPDTESQPVFRAAKEDLRQFCHEQPVHCRELLDRLSSRLQSGELHTMFAISFLEGFYHNWVPLSRLSKYIEDSGQVSA